ncbi:probable ubiquitin-conjugating enzyme E2 24 isoform X1 [Salvia splendens]|uniref:probable ubiquitin-conjugating enzyme E2 24 isoform X1 n=1 Tax=Salvia splendens TaxID=180675 RepID=UPI001C27C13D|nr:probable ubiquitin-conjugating enzyme E2 24 isoform X1 [Salvia splendens]
MDSLRSDFDSFSESSGSEDQEDIEFLYGPQACNIFSSLEESIQKIDDLLMFERGFLNGDVVCLVSDPLGQMGKVVNVDMIVDLENMLGTKTQNVDSRHLQKIQSVSVGDCVIYGPWLGKVEKVVDRVSILFDDGTKCQLNAEGPERIVALSQDFSEDLPYPFYPGQRVQVESSVPRSTRWLCDIRKNKHEQGTICDVDAGLVYVDWLCCAVSSDEKEPTPPCLQDVKNLSVLPCGQTNWQLGDWCVLPVEQSLPYSYASELLKGPKQSEMFVGKGDTRANFQNIAVIVKTKTKVDVLWQNGTQSLGLDSCLVYPVNIVDAHDFWPDVFVLEKGTVDDDSQVTRPQRWGVVRSVDPKERTVKVRWCKSSPDRIGSKEEQTEEVVSAYELVEHPDYCYSLGEVVFSAEKGILDLSDRDSPDLTVPNVHTGEGQDLGAVENNVDQTVYLNKTFLSQFGTVVGLKHEAIQVQWGTGAVTEVAPYEIYRVDKCESAASSVLGDETAQTPIEELPLKNQISGQKSKDVFGLDDDTAKNHGSHSISQVVLGVLTRVTSSLLGTLGTSLYSGYRCTSEVGDAPHEEEALELCRLNLDAQFPAEDDMESPEKMTSLQTTRANDDITLPSGSERSWLFRRFDMVNDCSDHHFAKESGMNLQSPQMKRSWLKKVHQEWSILEKDIPETIYVRVYEERMQLLRAAIVGSDGTPYHDGLFFFDIYLPPEYPNVPPMVYYNSGGLRINPNLYESGKVCLSLLNTWTGSESEVWNPSSSTILQLLLSLQALVLNAKPYFNEAGYDSQVGKAEGEKNSFSYNENAFLVSCRSMMFLLRRPPKHFEALVDEHFRSRCKNILLACKAYMRGAPIGNPFECGKADEEVQRGSSTGFKILLAKLYSRLVETFSDKGIDTSDFLDQNELASKPGGRRGS